MDNPLVGMQEHLSYLGDKKGANIEMMKELDENLQHYANMLKRYVSLMYLKYLVQGSGGMGAAVISVLKETW